MNRSPPAADPQPVTTPMPLILAAWLVVGVPAAWGVAQTVQKAAALFQPTNASMPATSVAPPPPPLAR